MKNIITISLFAIVLSISSSVKAHDSILSSLLNKHVSTSGNVNYTGFKQDEAKLDEYLAWLNRMHPSSSWSKNKEKAFWINVYNAYTIKLILNHFPLKSITDIKVDGKKAWDIEFVKVGGKTYSLNHIEHEILRKKFNDPRIHVGVNCASISCPKLYNKAFTESTVDSSLDYLMKSFINNTSKNKISATNLTLSEIFNWFKSDFTKNGSLISYLNKYSSVKIESNASITNLTYNWNLNGK